MRNQAFIKAVTSIACICLLAGCASPAGTGSSSAAAGSSAAASSSAAANSSAAADNSLKIYRVTDPEFEAYGQVMKGYDVSGLVKALDEKTPLPDGVEYVTGVPELEKTSAYETLKNNAYGGMPIQIGYCNGHNTKLNCLEYHRDSELNIGSTDYILLVAKKEDIDNGKLDTSKVKAFLAEAGEVVEVYSTTMHYAPCSAKAGEGFKVVVVLPKGTNEAKPTFTPANEEDKWMTAANKWLLAHEESTEASSGAYVGLTGKNIDISELLKRD